jgi:hypothetical protein
LAVGSLERSGKMDKVREWLKGKKTYLTAAATVLATVIAWGDGSLGTMPAILIILGACGFSSLRAAIAKIEAIFSGK